MLNTHTHTHAMEVSNLHVDTILCANKLLCGTVRAQRTVTGTSKGAGGSAGPRGSLLGDGAKGSIPYQIGPGTTVLGIGPKYCILTSDGKRPVWGQPPFRGYVVNFSSGGTTAGYQYANSGCIGLTDAGSHVDSSTVFVSPSAGSLTSASVLWAEGQPLATLVFGVNDSEIPISGFFQDSSGSYVVRFQAPLTIEPGDVLTVKTVTANLGRMTVTLYIS
jgi:hypothetical protein